MQLVPASVVLAALACLSGPAFSNSGTAEEVCPLMMGKLAIQYEIGTLDDRVAARKGEVPRNQNTAMKRADSMVMSAYGMTRAELNKKWPGFYAWAQLQAADGIKKLYKPEEFKERAVVACLDKYS